MDFSFRNFKLLEVDLLIELIEKRWRREKKYEAILDI